MTPQMTKEEFKELERGDIIRSKVTEVAYVVTANYGNRVTAVTSADVTNPSEWKLIKKREALETEPEANPSKAEVSIPQELVNQTAKQIEQLSQSGREALEKCFKDPVCISKVHFERLQAAEYACIAYKEEPAPEHTKNFKNWEKLYDNMPAICRELLKQEPEESCRTINVNPDNPIFEGLEPWRKDLTHKICFLCSNIATHCGTENRCCTHYVLAGNPPADWHSECMRTYCRLEELRKS